MRYKEFSSDCWCCCTKQPCSIWHTPHPFCRNIWVQLSIGRLANVKFGLQILFLCYIKPVRLPDTFQFPAFFYSMVLVLVCWNCVKVACTVGIVPMPCCWREASCFWTNQAVSTFRVLAYKIQRKGGVQGLITFETLVHSLPEDLHIDRSHLVVFVEALLKFL